MQESQDIEMQQPKQYISLDTELYVKQISYFDLIRQLLPLLLLDVKTLTASNYDPFKKQFVTKLKWIKESHYNQSIEIIETIPGACTAQLLVAIGTLSKKSAIAGVIAVFFYTLPSALILLGSALILRQYQWKELHSVVYVALYGVRAANVALIVQICLKMIMDYVKNRLDVAIVVVTASTVFIYPYPETLLTLIVLGGLLMLMQEYDIENGDDKNLLELQQSQEKLDKYQLNPLDVITQKNSDSLSSLLGSKSLHIYILIWIMLLWVSGRAHDQKSEYAFLWDLALSFYKIGTLLIGGTPVTLPYMYVEIQSHYMDISEDAFWIGFALAAALPGPYLNFSIFVGAHTAGFWGGIVCWVFIYIPSILQFWGLLPYSLQMRQNKYVFKFKEGVLCVSIGFLLTAIYYSWVNATAFDVQTATIISALSLIYIVMLNFNSPGVIVFGAVLFVMRHLALSYYRKIDPSLA